ncbi:hydrogenase expression protein HupH [Paucibacter sp. KBW04]|uniref:aspartate/glutamate racemase family protein n=1 Tax=Paucibacter sp. KBW04 TaxID=2153361 RepID=UPI000F58932B|nr:aspartate/glutamate racemase family protein [Paucibacter sp. KBW04]RQO59978.1 hydrogenase expression protein HupH [Paucibacter sp. KBW04]
MTTKRIKVITPIITEGLRDLADLRALEHPGLRIAQTLLKEGPSSIESAFEEMLAAPGVVAAALQAQAEGFDAVIVDCFADPGLQAARELLDIPVFGPGECSMHAAAMLGLRFSIVTVLPAVVPMLTELAQRYGVADKLSSIRVIDIPVLALHGDPQALQKAMGEQACKAVLEDGADAIVLGCTGFLGCANVVSAELNRVGLNGVPVIDPIPVTVHMATALCQSGLSHSKRGWPKPAKKPMAGFADLQAQLG